MKRIKRRALVLSFIAFVAITAGAVTMTTQGSTVQYQDVPAGTASTTGAVTLPAAPPASTFTPDTSPPSAYTSAPATRTPPGCHPLSSSGRCYRPGDYCPQRYHGESGVGAGISFITCEYVGGTWRWRQYAYP